MFMRGKDVSTHQELLTQGVGAHLMSNPKHDGEVCMKTVAFF